MSMPQPTIGQPIRRTEDARLLTGAGCYGDDVILPGMLYAVFLRTPHAHARIMRIETEAARAMPGVRAVLTGADYIADGGQPIPHAVALLNPPDLKVRVTQTPITTEHYPLQSETVRFVGEAVAMVIAESIGAARDAVERIDVTYESLAAVTRAADAVGVDAPRLWLQSPDNRCVGIEAGDKHATDAAFARAAHVVRLETRAQRITGIPMEPRTLVATYDDATGYMLHSGSGRGVAKLRADLATALGTEAERVRIQCGDMGGNYGTRNFFYPEYALLAWAARRVGAAVKWRCERSESFLTDYQGRDLSVSAELALDAEGRFLAARGENLSNLGAQAASFVSLHKGLGLLTSVYNVPVAYVYGVGAVTNTVPTTPYRSAGRPEVIFVIERLIDLAARKLGMDRAEIRRRNLVPPVAQPFTNPLGLTYDSGDYPRAMQRALELAAWADFPARLAAARQRNRLRGIGIANYIEVTSGSPRERTEITVRSNGRVELVMGTMDSGQGHATTFAQLVSDWLGVPHDSIDYVAHDTARVHAGGGSHSGRSMKLAVTIIGAATDEIIAKGKTIAAALLQARADEIDFAAGDFRVRGSDHVLDIFSIARAAATEPTLPEELRGPLSAISDQTLPIASFPYGAQVCEVEVDPETGRVAVVGLVAVDDVGRAVNPMILHGQAHGGIAQGVGQALLEDCHYDPETGQMLAASFMDYAIPRADDLPALRTELSEVPSPTNRLGVRSGGEGGCTPALAAVVNAIVDALSELGVTHIEMPATPERVWRTMRGAA